MLILPPIRQQDKFGSGVFGAKRGSRGHNGIDICVPKGSYVCSTVSGNVTKIGQVYSKPEKSHKKYIEVIEPATKNRWRYFYVDALATVGQTIWTNQILGKAQGLQDIYPGITDHVHLEIIDVDGNYIDPTQLIYG